MLDLVNTIFTLFLELWMNKSFLFQLLFVGFVAFIFTPQNHLIYSFINARTC